MDQVITGCVIAFSPLLWIIFKSHDCIHYPLHMCATLLYLYSDNVGCTCNVTDNCLGIIIKHILNTKIIRGWNWHMCEKWCFINIRFLLAAWVLIASFCGSVYNFLFQSVTLCLAVGLLPCRLRFGVKLKVLAAKCFPLLK